MRTASVLVLALLPLVGSDAPLSMPLQHRVVRPDARGRADPSGAPTIPRPIRRMRRREATAAGGDDSGASGGARRGLQAGVAPLSPRPESLGVLASESNGYAYYATVHLGDPAVAIGVDLDTGSASLAVPSAFCDNCAVDIDTFNPQHSRSATAMSCDDTQHCDNTALLWNPDCVADMGLESSPDMDATELQAWKRQEPGWMAPTFRRVRLLFDHGSCVAAAAISGLFTVDAAEPTIAGQPHYSQEVCETPGADPNCATYHLHYRKDLSETNWPWVIATWDDGPGGEAQDHMDIEYLARFAADMTVVRAGLSLGESVLAQCLHPTAGFQASSLAVRAYAPYGPASCCAGHSHACLHSDYYSDGSGTTGPVYHDTVRVGDTSVRTVGYFKAFEDDEGGVASGGHFTSSHSSAGIWGLAPEPPSSSSKITGVKDMGSILSGLLADNGLADAFALCFDDSPAAFSDGDGAAASSLDLGGPDARKYHGAMQFLPLLPSQDGYFIDCSQETTQMSLFVGDSVMDPTMDAARVDPAARLNFKRIQIDSGTATTLSLPQAIERAVGRTILDWFRAEYDLSSGAAATAVNVATQLFAPDGNGCIALSTHIHRTVALFPTLTLVFSDVRGQPLHLSLPPTSYLEIWPQHHAMCLLIEGDSDESTGMLAAGFLRRYYTLFDRQNARIGMAERGDCTPDEPPSAINTAEAHCAARASDGCASCAGPVDDLELDKGYCTWCPSTATCNAYDPRAVGHSAGAPCQDAQGWDQATLDAPPGGHCPELSTMERTCQAGYMKVTDLAMRGGVEGTCGAQAQQAIASYSAACETTKVRMHLRGKTVALPGSACLLSVLSGSTSVHGMDQCSIPPPMDPANRGCNGADHNSSCAYENDGECDAGSYCPDGSDLSDCYGSKIISSCAAHAHGGGTWSGVTWSGGCTCDVGFTATAAGDACEAQDTASVPRDHTGVATAGGPALPEKSKGTDTGNEGANSCWWANDGMCDGGDSCAPGTDTNDCNAIGGATNLVPSSIDCPGGWVYDPVDAACIHPPSGQLEATSGDGLGNIDGEPVCPPHAHASAGRSCSCDAGYTSVDADCVADDRNCGEDVQMVNESCPPPQAGLTTPSSCPADCAAAFVPWWTRCCTDESIVASLGDSFESLRVFNSRCTGQSGPDGGGK